MMHAFSVTALSNRYKVSVDVQHVLSIESEDWKREFIVSSHTIPGEKPSFCLFNDVAVLEQDEAFCHTCGKKHSTSIDLDVLLSGPSCKDNSYQKQNRTEYTDNYVTFEGTSGSTYKLGYKGAIARCNPAVSFFENTVGVADAPKDKSGVRQRSRVEAWMLKKVTC